jgi:DNA polymerase-3 subunit epsilon
LTILFFDTETTGLPKNYKAPITDHENWPRMVQLGWMRYDRAGQLLEQANQIVRPEGFTIPRDAARVHGITTERALREGEPLGDVLAGFAAAIERSDLLVAHNMDFDEKIAGAEFHRCELPNRLMDTPHLCTMKTTSDLCQLPGRFGYKWPRLEELHRHLFGTSFQDAHDASVDVRICAKCYFELVGRGFYRLD